MLMSEVYNSYVMVMGYRRWMKVRVRSRLGHIYMFNLQLRVARVATIRDLPTRTVPVAVGEAVVAVLVMVDAAAVLLCELRFLMLLQTLDCFYECVIYPSISGQMVAESYLRMNAQNTSCTKDFRDIM